MISVKWSLTLAGRSATPSSSIESRTMLSISSEIVRSIPSPSAQVRTFQRGANQQAALFMPMPNSAKPLRSLGNSAGRKARA